MQTQRINITIPAELIRDLRRRIPHRSRSKFIGEAIKQRLAKRRNLKAEVIKSLKANYAFDKKEAKVWSALDAKGWPEW